MGLGRVELPTSRLSGRRRPSTSVSPRQPASVLRDIRQWASAGVSRRWHHFGTTLQNETRARRGPDAASAPGTVRITASATVVPLSDRGEQEAGVGSASEVAAWSEPIRTVCAMRRYACQGERSGRFLRSPTRLHPHYEGRPSWRPVHVAVRPGCCNLNRGLVRT